METDDIFSDDDSFFSLTSVEISQLKNIRTGGNRAIALGTDETIIIDAEHDLNLQEKRIQYLHNNTPYNTINQTVFQKQIYHTTAFILSIIWLRDLSYWSKIRTIRL